MASNKTILDAYLDDNEKLAVQMFIDNEIQREAIKKVLLFGVYQNGTLKKGKQADPMLNFALGLVSNAEELQLDNEKLGAQLRAAWEGIKFVELAFNNMANYKKQYNKVEPKTNPAI